MANMALTKLTLYDRWPGDPEPGLMYPTRTNACGSNGKGWDNTNDNFCSGDDTQRALNAAPATGSRIPLGQKRRIYYDSTENPGSYTMMYLAFHCHSAASTYCDISKDFSDGNFWCAPAGVGCISASEYADTSKGPYYVVGPCYTGTDVTKGSPMCIPCSTNIRSDGTTAATNGYGDGCGWFLVGGVMPINDITILDNGADGAGKGAEITCACERGSWMAEVTGGTALIMATDMSDLADATDVAGTGKDMAGMIQGWCCGSSV
ncbi:MAG TPA: hypothetical protein HPP87_07270 [Planctomycetes bacterium]|nr:hypothetical protein [Planctomycetota bacterium]